MTDDFTPDEERDVAPAEYVLRLMSREEEQAFEIRLQNDAELRNDVAVWAEQFAYIGEQFSEVEPPRAIKARLMREIRGPDEAPRTSVWSRLILWRSYALLATAAAIGFAALFLVQPTIDAPGDVPLFVSEIAAEDDSLRVLAVYDAETANLRLTRTSGEAAPGRDLELWAIVGDNAPLSLGVLPPDATAQLVLPDALRDVIGDAVLAISDEPAGGSTTGAPTGDVLAVGEVNAL